MSRVLILVPFVEEWC